MQTKRLTTLFIAAMAVWLTGYLSPIPALAQDECCVPGGPFGDGSDGDVEVPRGIIFLLEPGMNYRNVTVKPGGMLDTRGHLLLVCGTLTNEGTITDTVNGGDGGDGGDGGAGADPLLNNPPPHSPPCKERGVYCTDGEPGEPGKVPRVPQAGRGGDGGGGGGGGGGAWAWKGSPKEADADGGDGGDGSPGGRGGGYVRIYAFHFKNPSPGVIHANGGPGFKAKDAPQPAQPAQPPNCGAEYYKSEDPPIYDIAGGGGGGGAGGDGGDGGTVEIYTRFELKEKGQVTARGGLGGKGGKEGGGHCLIYGAFTGGHSSGCEGAGCAGDGGDGEHRRNRCSGNGTPGCNGSPGKDGNVEIKYQCPPEDNKKHLKKLKCRRKCNGLVIAKVKKAVPGASLYFCLDDPPDRCDYVVVNEKGKAKKKWCDAGSGEHTVRVHCCGWKGDVTCP